MCTSCRVEAELCNYGDCARMGFRAGSIAYSRFSVLSDPPTLDSALLAKIRKHILSDVDGIKPGESACGWTGGRHLFDISFTPESILFGSGLLLGFRIDSVRVPPEIKKAYIAMAEESHLVVGKDGGSYLPRAARKEAREEALRRIDEEVANGRYRAPKHAAIWWDFATNTMLAPVSSDKDVEMLKTLVDDTFGVRIAPRASGTLAYDLLGERGLSGAFDDAHAEAFSAPPADIEGAVDQGQKMSRTRPEVPWANTAGESKDFLGNTFLFWLCWQAETNEGLFETEAGEIALIVDRMIDLECAWGLSGKTSVRGSGPLRRMETVQAFKGGKWPRKVGLMLHAFGQNFEFVLQGDRMEVSALKLPKPEEKPQSLRQAIEMRLDQFASFDRAFSSLFAMFVRDRFSPAWPTRRGQIDQWVTELGSMRKIVALAEMA